MSESSAISRPVPARRSVRLPAVEAVRWFGMGAAAIRPVLVAVAAGGLVLVGASWLDAWSPLGWAVRLGIGAAIGAFLIAGVFSGLQSASRWAGRNGRIRAATLVERRSVCHDLGLARRPEGWLVAAADLGGTIPGIPQSATDRSASHDGVTMMLSIRANERGQAATGRAIGRATRAASINIIRQRLIAPAALLALAGLSVALSPAVALAGVERVSHGAWREARGGEASPSFSRWNIALEIDGSAIHTAQRGGPLSVHATVHDAGFGGLVGLLADERSDRRSVRTNFEIRPAPDERQNLRNTDHGQTGSPIVLPATSASADRERFEASAAGRILSSLNTDRVQVRAASYTPPLPRITPRSTPRLGGSSSPSHAGRPGWWRGVSEWRVVDLEPTPALERLWVRITGADGLLRGLYELDPQREGQRVPASAGDVVTIEVDSSVQLWGMEVELTEKDAAMPEQPVPVDAVFEEVERGVSDRVAWRSYRICGHEGSEVGVGVRAIAQRRMANGAGAGAARGLVSDTSSPFSLLIAQASDWVATTQSAEASQPVEEVSEAASSSEPAPTGVAARDSERTDAGETTPTTSTRLTGAAPSIDSNARPDAAANDTRAVPTAQPQAGGEPTPAPREKPRNNTQPDNTNNNETGAPQQRPATGPTSQPTGEPQLGGDPEPGSSGRTTRRAPAPEPEPNPEPEITPPTQRVGGGDEPEMVQSVALFIPRSVERTGDPVDADRMITVLGLDAISPEDRTIALAYRRVLINEARKAGQNGKQVQNTAEPAGNEGSADERSPKP